MEEIYLKEDETFFEYPNKYLKITSNSNIYYIKLNNKKYIAKSNIDSLESTNDLNTNILVQSFYNVLDGSKVLTRKKIISKDKAIASTNFNAKIIRLSKILNLTGNGVVEFSINDINTILEYKEEKAKKYRKFYF